MLRADCIKAVSAEKGYMKVLRFIRNTIAQWYYEWAMREINPMHQDVPRIMMRQLELKAEARRLVP